MTDMTLYLQAAYAQRDRVKRRRLPLSTLIVRWLAVVALISAFVAIGAEAICIYENWRFDTLETRSLIFTVAGHKYMVVAPDHELTASEAKFVKRIAASRGYPLYSADGQNVVDP